MNSVTENRLIKLHGSGIPLPSPVELKAGDLKLHYENGSIRNISINGYELIRMIYPAVRDDKWVTIEPVISSEEISVSNHEFRIRWQANYRSNEIDFEARYNLSGGPGNVVRFEMTGKANSNFQKNRIGFCVLHPLESCKGKPCKIVHPDGSSTASHFPDKISPHQPFTDISAMEWELGKDLKMNLKFSGDVFETEDQRNWTDSSYKTYSTPLSIPYPVNVNKGYEMFQKVEFAARSKINKANVGANVTGVFKCRLPDKTDNLGANMPEVGLGVSSRKSALSFSEASCIKGIGFSYLRGELHLFAPYLTDQYHRVKNESDRTLLPVQVCLFFDDDIQSADQLDSFLKLYKEKPFAVHSFILFSAKAKVTPQEVFKRIKPALKKEFSNTPVGAGTNCNFAQLNHEHAIATRADLISYAVHPREHAGDDITVLENVAAQKDTVETAVGFSGGRSVFISPVTLQRRFNANVSTYEKPGIDKNNLPMPVDTRQMSLFCSVWTVGSLKYLLGSGVKGICYFETVGERGIFMGNRNSGWPSEFHATKGMFFPVYHVFTFLLRNKPSRLLLTESTIPGQTEGFAFISGSHGYILIANFTGIRQSVKLEDFPNLKTVFRLNTNTFAQAISRQNYSEGMGTIVRNPTIELLPYETRGLMFIF